MVPCGLPVDPAYRDTSRDARFPGRKRQRVKMPAWKKQFRF